MLKVIVARARAFLAVALVLGVAGPVHAQSAAPYAFHYETIVNPEALPPQSATYGDLYLNISESGVVSGTYRKFNGGPIGPTYAVYGTRTRDSLNLQLELDTVMTISGFVSGDRFEGSAFDGVHNVGFRARVVN